jgi:4-amino-4-deoxy-L-arabinose transferase-like glycosyltransferase
MSNMRAVRATVYGALVAMLLTALFYSTFYNRFLGLRSGAGEFAGGDAIVHGIVPFRDYFTATPPLSQFKAGLLLWLFGDKLIVLRTAGMIERSLIALLVYLWLRRIARPAHAAFAAFATLVLSAGDLADPIASYNHDSMLFAILSGYLASFLLEWVRPIRFTVWMAIASGVAAGLSLMVKQTIGLGAVAAVPVVVAAMLWRRQSLRQALLWLASFAAGAAAPIGALLIWLARLGVLKTFLVQVFVKGPAAKAQNGGGDFITRALTVVGHSPRQLLPAAAGAAILVWLLLRATRWSEEPDAEQRPSWELLRVAVASTGCIVLGVVLSFERIGHAHVSWPVNMTILMCMGIAAVLAVGTWQLLWGSLSDRRAQAYLLAAVSFNTAFMLSLSFPVFPAMLLPGIGLLIAGGLAGGRGVGRLAIYAVVLMLCTNLMRMKLDSPFGFGSFAEGPVADATVASNQAKLKGIYLPEDEVQLVDGVAATVTANTTASDTIFTYPEMGIFYALTERRYPTETGSHNVDVVNDAMARSEAARLLANPPKVLIYLPETAEQLSAQEAMWRGGRRMGQREIIAAVETLADTYRLAGVYGTKGNESVFVYVRP